MPFASRDLTCFNASISEIDALYHAAAVRMGVSDSVQYILYVICTQGEGCTQADICRTGSLSKQTINTSIRQMEREGLLTLTQGRPRRIALTETGRTLMQRTAQPLVEIENSILAGWTQEERAAYLRLTQRYADEFRKKINCLPQGENA